MSTNLVRSDRRMRKTRRTSGRIDVAAGTPSIAQGSGFTISDDAAGKVTVTLNKGGSRLLFAHAIPIQNTDATGFYAKVMGVPSASAVQFGIYQADGVDGVLVDNVSFFFEILVSDSRI